MIKKLRVTGMTCAACSARVEKVSANVSGVNKAEVNLLAGTMMVDVVSEDVIDRITDAVRGAGYDAFLDGKADKPKTSQNDLRSIKTRIFFSGVFLVVLMYFTMGHMVGLPLPGWYHGEENAMVAVLVQFLLTVPVVFLNRSYYSRGIKALWNRAPNMDTLIAVGSGASLVYGLVALFAIAYGIGHGNLATVRKYSENLYFESAAMILTLITIGKYLEAQAKGKTGDAIQKLMDLTPKTAFVRYDDAVKEVPVENVRIGDIVIVRSGGRIPVDGTVIQGRAAIDQSALTGESIPVEKAVGDTVAASSINAEGYIEMRADQVGENTTLAQIIRLVEDAGGSKAPIARLADKIAGIFVPVVMGISMATFLIWMFADQTISFALTCSIAVLVISCPCALGLATPVAIMVGTGRAATMGVLFKNAEALENLHSIDTVVLDKTGTLTIGKPVVTDILAASVTEKELLRVAASLESMSEHPFAKAILAENSEELYLNVQEFQTLPGQGLCAIINETRYYGGNKRLMESIAVTVPDYPELAKQGKTVLYFASKDNYLGAIAAADVLKDDSYVAVKNMHHMGMEVVMLTGDNEITAKAIADQAGIDRVVANMLPDRKASAIQMLQKEGKKVLMVGDGINDAPALVTADIGMAIGAGTDIAIESANVVLMNSSLVGVCDAVQLSRSTIRNIKQNLFWAFFYNCLGIPIAAGALYPAFGIQLSPMIGAAAMSLSSFFVVSNALRLRFFKKKIINATIIDDNFKEENTMEIIIKVDGMMCPHCKARVESVCKIVEGATDAIVDLEKKQVTVTGNASVEALKKAITEAGYQVIEE